jgi:hypothetical protein
MKCCYCALWGESASGGVPLIPIIGRERPTRCISPPRSESLSPRSGRHKGVSEMFPVSPGRLFVSALGDDLPRGIAAVFTAARNSSRRCVQCGNLIRNRRPPGVLVIPPIRHREHGPARHLLWDLVMQRVGSNSGMQCSGCSKSNRELSPTT